MTTLPVKVTNLVDRQEKTLITLAEASAGNVLSWLEEVAEAILRDKRRTVEKAMKRRGLDDVLSETQEQYEEIVLMAEELISTVSGRAFSIDTNRQQIEQLITMSQQGIVKQLSANLDGTRTAIAQTVLLGERPNYAALAESVHARSVPQITTEFNTEYAAFHRASNQTAADEAGITKFVYYGGLIKDSRPFCRAHAGKTYTAKQLAKMTNDQGLPVMPYLGGYNCRHLLVPVE